MGFFNDISKKLPWNAYAEKEKALIDLASEIFGEAGIYKDDTYDRKDQEDYNSSDFDIAVYEKMLTDGQVKAALDMIKLSSTAKGFNVIGDDAETKKYADFINQNFELIRGNMEDVIGEMLSALEYGYSCTEKVFEQKDGKIVLKKLKVLNPHSVRVKTDRFGDIEFVKQRIGSKTIKIPAQKVIWYAYDKRFGDPYGNSILRTTYKHWYIKDKMYRFANIAYERYGTPLLVGNVQDARDVGKMTNLLKKINSMTGLAISGDDKIQAIQGSNADFVGYIEHHDRKIMESMLVPPMMLGVGRGQSGSYALTGNQFDIFMIRLEALQRDLKALLEEEVVRPLIDLNFPNVRRYPSFAFKPIADRDIEKIARVFDLMIKGGVVAPTEEWLREEMGFPAMDEETKKALEEAKKAAQEALKGKGKADSEEGSDGGSEGSGEDAKGKSKEEGKK